MLLIKVLFSKKLEILREWGWVMFIEGEVKPSAHSSIHQCCRELLNCDLTRSLVKTFCLKKKGRFLIKLSAEHQGPAPTELIYLCQFWRKHCLDTNEMSLLEKWQLFFQGFILLFFKIFQANSH